MTRRAEERAEFWARSEQIESEASDLIAQRKKWLQSLDADLAECRRLVAEFECAEREADT